MICPHCGEEGYVVGGFGCVWINKDGSTSKPGTHYHWTCCLTQTDERGYHMYLVGQLKVTKAKISSVVTRNY